MLLHVDGADPSADLDAIDIDRLTTGRRRGNCHYAQAHQLLLDRSSYTDCIVPSTLLCKDEYEGIFVSAPPPDLLTMTSRTAFPIGADCSVAS